MCAGEMKVKNPMIGGKGARESFEPNPFFNSKVGLTKLKSSDGQGGNYI